MTTLLANGGVYGRTSQGLGFSREPRVTMAKERLTISLEKIRVEYVFRNDSDQDVTTQILFPAACYYGDDELGYASGPEVGTNFQVWCDGKPKPVSPIIKAIKKRNEDVPESSTIWTGEDVTAILKPLGLLQPDFGASNLHRLKPADIVRLWKRGLTPVVASDPFPEEDAPASEWLALAEKALRTGNFQPNWSIFENYLWKQVFPARRQIQLVIEYAPIPLSEDAIYPIDGPEIYQGLPNLEGNGRSLQREVMAQAKRLGRPLKEQERDDFGRIPHHWIDYVLTTANTWKGPIEDFELIVEGGVRTPVSFAWPGPVERLGRNCYRVRLKHFRPRRDLQIHFYPL